MHSLSSPMWPLSTFLTAILPRVPPQIAEQRFKHINGYQGLLRQMGKARFEWTLLTIVDMDHRFRRSGALDYKVASKAPAAGDAGPLRTAEESEDDTPLPQEIEA
jgi:hypothetical protein